ncbi:MAG: fibronectin type III domain-containing protein, partial [Thermoplasmatota archaeon]
MRERGTWRVGVLTLLLVLGCMGVLMPDAGAEAWVKVDMGRPYENSYYGLRGVAVGDGDRDKSSEVYFTCYDNSRVYQFTWTDDGWVWEDIGGAGSYANCVVVGDGDDDGSPEVYATGYTYTYPSYGPVLNQIYKDKDGWHVNNIQTSGYWPMDIAIGDGNNDNRTELYTGDYYYGHIYQHTKAQTWNVADVGNASPPSGSSYVGMLGVTVGDGDNDGYNEVYGSSSIGYVYKFSWDGSSWKRSTVGRGDIHQYGETYSSIYGLRLGDADNDGKTEVYAVSWTNASVYRFKWSPGQSRWERTALASLGTGIYAYSLAVGDADSDGKEEIYAGTYKQVYKVWYDEASGEWKSAAVGGGNGYMYDLAIGSATNDTSQQELYSACLDGHAYQFYTDRTPPKNPVVWSDTHPTPGTWYNKSTVHVLWKEAGYDISGVDGYSYKWDTSPGTVPDDVKDVEEKVHEAYSSSLTDGGSWYFHIRVRDNALNWNSTATHFGPICIDTKPPTSVQLKINDGADYTNNKIVTLSITAVDPSPGSGVSHMALSNNGKDWTDWEPFSGTRPYWDLTDSRYGGNDTDGTKTVHVKLRDGAGNLMGQQDWGSDSIFLDRAGPEKLSILVNGGAEYTTSSEVGLSLSASDPEPASGLGRMALSNDGIVWSDWMDWSGSASWSLTSGAGGSDADGSKSVFLKVVDMAGNLGGPVKDDIFLDRRAPEGLSVVVNDGAEYTNSSSVSLSISASDPYPGSQLTEMALGNQESTYMDWEPFSNSKRDWSLTVGAGGTDSDGSKSVYMKARDRAGNVGGPVSDSIFLDRAKPGPLGISINDGATYTTSPNVNLSLRASDPDPASGVYAMQFSEEGTRWSDWEEFRETRAYTLPSGDGVKTVFFRVRDRAGNVAGSVSDAIILDTTPPLISNIQVVGITDTSATVTWATSEEADSGVDWGLTSSYGSSMRDDAFTTAHSLTLKGLSASTTYHFRVHSTDRAGNPTTYSSDYIFITAPTPDTTPPIITSVAVGGVTDNLAVVTWATNEPADSTVHYGRDTSYGMRAEDSSFVLKHSVVIRDLSPSTTYHIRVESTDPSGNGPATSGDYTFTTLATPDTAPPRISGVRVDGVTDRLAVVSWETDEPADSVVEYGQTAAYGLTVSDGRLARTHEMKLLSLLPRTTYHFRVLSKDATGNGPSFSEDFTFTTTDTPDTTPPVISAVSVESITESSAILVWETDEPSDSFADFGPTTAYGQTAADSALVLRHSLLLLGLSPDTGYHARVRSADASGNPATGPDITFRTRKTPTAPDTTPPLISQVQVAGVSTDRAVVTWYTDELADSEVDYGTSTDYGLRAYEPSHTIFHSVVLFGLNASTEYHLRVKSTDAFGNGPSIGPDITFTTASLPDTTPPVISKVVVTNVTNSSAVISWVTSEPADSHVEFGLDVYYGRTQSSGVFVFNHTVQLVGLSPGTTYHFKVRSMDASGNWAPASEDQTFTTLKGGTGPGPAPPTPGGEVASTVGGVPWWVWLVLMLLVVGGAYAAYIYTRGAPGAPPTPPGAPQVSSEGAPAEEEVETIEMTEAELAPPESVEEVPAAGPEPAGIGAPGAPVPPAA